MLRALDLFCGEGGATRGLQLAGYHVTGIDLTAREAYCGDAFIQGDALSAGLTGYDLVWASPPCQRYSSSTKGNQRNLKHPDLIGPVRQLLQASGVPWVIENVPGAPLQADAVLCGSHFGLPLRRHRVFEASFPLSKPPACDHSRPVVGVYGHPHGKRGAWPGMLPSTLQTWRDAMGMPWATAKGLAQAIPPAYAQWIAEHLSK